MNREVTIAASVRILMGCSLVMGSALAALTQNACSSSSAPAGVETGGGGTTTGDGKTASGGGTNATSDSGTGAATNADGGNDRRRRVHIFPNTDMLYSGFDGTHTYAVPVGAFSPASGAITWTLSDDTVATVKPVVVPADPASDGHGTVSYVDIVTKKVGTVTITATANGQAESIALTVSAYTTDQYALGEKRYVNGGGGSPACFSCHFPDGGVDHSPSYTAEWPDDGVAQIFTTGVRPDGSKLRTPKHNWSVTDAEKPGVVAYLRALPIPPPTDD